MYFLGIDLGSSSIKLSLLESESNRSIGRVSVPDMEMGIMAPQFGWAEQDPDLWWKYIKQGITILRKKHQVDIRRIAAIGIAYQMHGLVLVDSELKPVRPSIIWCDSRAAELGEEIYRQVGAERCQGMLLGSPGNFTASKLAWVKRNEPEVFAKAAFMMLPGDYIASSFSQKAQTSVSGLSEAALWDFSRGRLAYEILEQMELSPSLIPEIVPNFGPQSVIHPEVAQELGLNPSLKITYRGGDQPNNALSLNVLQPGEIAATAGTSAVIYSVTNQDIYDKENRVNTFLHVNNTKSDKKNGVMLCINGSGILYQWLRKILSTGRDNLLPYETLNKKAAEVAPGSAGLLFYPFGNGVERIFNNKKATSGVQNLNYNLHHSAHLIRAACEGIVFAMNYGFDVIKSIGTSPGVVRAGNSNLFLSPVFREIFTNTTQSSLEIYNTSGSEGAARGAAYGFGFHTTLEQAFEGLECVERLEPSPELASQYEDLYLKWKQEIKTNQEHE